ncbi:MAG: hypothetical protein QXJ69_03785 [Desulfurococcaceae archaeon]
MQTLRVTHIYKVGPRRIARFGKVVGIYLPTKLSFLAGKTVMLTIEVMEEATWARGSTVFGNILSIYKVGPRKVSGNQKKGAYVLLPASLRLLQGFSFDVGL